MPNAPCPIPTTHKVYATLVVCHANRTGTHTFVCSRLVMTDIDRLFAKVDLTSRHSREKNFFMCAAYFFALAQD
ncbi:hypothetical protein G7B40_004350 [Aetokthonos hydrillicola Thurmond2011]|uniref:Uncharacterized protein n=1 Tax=Aetokthonos hydrillicola Thurmond2011 TaxID=2712845 RepID=A0AAP5I7C3_9CYAN|nr:hypothetical protein [Aetokthonos hydrillicola CCALA 1050]MDR9893805.1 hypothetical protein [Aetokthonos hydrillicola Thurmond2011]